MTAACTFNPYGKLMVPVETGQYFVGAATLPGHQAEHYWGPVVDAAGLPVPRRGEHFGPPFPQIGLFTIPAPEGPQYANYVRYAQPVGSHMQLRDLIELAVRIAARDWRYNIDHDLGPSRVAADAAVRATVPTRLIGGDELYRQVVTYIRANGEQPFNRPSYRNGSFLVVWDYAFFPPPGVAKRDGHTNSDGHIKRDHGHIMALLARFIDVVISATVSGLVDAG
jgi:hypothetical protein